MASDDRERTFEKALARHLRPSTSSSPDGGGLAGARADLCPDPELLAAYHDGSLSQEERNLWKQHVVGCDRCQFVLAHLETPLEVLSLAAKTENTGALEQLAVPVVKAASLSRTPRPSLLHSLRWLWIVPAGVVAATLIAWVSLQERKPSPASPSAPVEVAENRQPLVAAPPASQPSAPTAKNERAVPAERKENDQANAPSPNAAASADRDLAANALRNEVQLTQQAPLQNLPKVNHGPSLSAQKQEQQISRIAGTSGGALDLKKSDAGTQAKQAPRAVGGAQPIPAPPPAEPSFLANESVSAPRKDQAPPASVAPAPAPAGSPAANAAAAKTKPASADAISSVTETVEVTGASSTVSNALASENGKMRVAALQNPRVFWAPGGKQAWRVGPAGSVEHSKDKGVTWTPQISGVYTDLVAASAPSAKVCWIVGTAGTILLTTDGGTHWTKLDSPVTNDLTGIRADNAKHVWIWFVPDPQTGVVQTFQSSDGGRTWRTLAGE
jgi:hypothetical protein